MISPIDLYLAILEDIIDFFAEGYLKVVKCEWPLWPEHEKIMSFKDNGTLGFSDETNGCEFFSEQTPVWYTLHDTGRGAHSM